MNRFKVGGAIAATGLAVWGVSKARPERESFKDREVSAVARKAMEQLRPQLIGEAKLREERFLGVFPGREVDDDELIGALAVGYDKALEIKRGEPRFKVRGCDWDLTDADSRPKGIFLEAVKAAGVDPDSVDARADVWAGIQPCTEESCKVFCGVGDSFFVKEEVS